MCLCGQFPEMENEDGYANIHKSSVYRGLFFHEQDVPSQWIINAVLHYILNNKNEWPISSKCHISGREDNLCGEEHLNLSAPLTFGSWSSSKVWEAINILRATTFLNGWPRISVTPEQKIIPHQALTKEKKPQTSFGSAVRGHKNCGLL